MNNRIDITVKQKIFLKDKRYYILENKKNLLSLKNDDFYFLFKKVYKNNENVKGCRYKDIFVIFYKYDNTILIDYVGIVDILKIKNITIENMRNLLLDNVKKQIENI